MSPKSAFPAPSQQICDIKFSLDIPDCTNFTQIDDRQITPTMPSPFRLPCLPILVPSMNRKPAHEVSLQLNSYK